MKLGIRQKFLLSYLLLFICAALIVYQFMKISLDANSRAQIEAEMTKLQHTTREHIKQFAEIKGTRAGLFEKNGTEVARDLSRLHNLGVALYSPEGRFLYEELPIEETRLLENQRFQKNLGANGASELAAAFENKSAMTIEKTGKGIFVYFAYPLYIDGEFLGAVRFTGDYTDLFAQNGKILRTFAWIAVFLLIGIFAVSFFLTNQIIRPLFRLSKAARKMAKGEYEEEIGVRTGDELEELAGNFTEMRKSVKEHIDMVEAEKEKVVRLEKNRTAFFQHVTHELKTPLSIISGYAQILAEPDFDDGSFSKKAAGKIVRESGRLDKMVADLINIAKKQAAAETEAHRPFRLRPLLEEVCEDMSMQADDKKMEITVTGTDWELCGSREGIRQVLLNLLGNAVKHGAPGGTIQVHTTTGSVKVKNPSSPISDYMLAHAFEPFIYEKKEGNSGLGLYISREIILAHGGSISIDYENGMAVLSVLLPAMATNRQ